MVRKGEPFGQWVCSTGMYSLMAQDTAFGRNKKGPFWCICEWGFPSLAHALCESKSAQATILVERRLSV